MLDKTKKTAPLVKDMGGRDIIEVTIANGASLSEAINIEGFRYIAILMPSAWTAANLTFQASSTIDGTFANVYGDDGTEISVTAAASRMISINNFVKQAALLPLSFIKIRSGTAGTPVNQGADRTLTLICKG